MTPAARSSTAATALSPAVAPVVPPVATGGRQGAGHGEGLYRYCVFGAVLSAAGLPIYIHAPAFAAETYGLSLTAIGTALFGLRVLDFAQDPLLGWIADRAGRWQGHIAALVTLLLAGSMVALFAVPAPIDPMIWFVGCLAVLFSAFSFLWILFYARGIARGAALGRDGPLRLAAWREIGTLGGICLSSIVPSLLMLTALKAPLAVYALGYAALTGIAALVMAPEWRRPVAGSAAGPDDSGGTPGGLRALLRDRVVRRLLVVGLFNAAPVAVSATVFLFYVEIVLQARTAAGPLLLAFFLAAAISAPGWSRAANRFGTRRSLVAAMLLAICSFSLALFLGPGDVVAFAAICLVSGAALGADFTLLPALFSRSVNRMRGGGGQAFGLWNFCSKITLALAATTVLPLLDAAGFSASGDNPPQVVWTLVVLYAGVPPMLKIIALTVLCRTPIEEVSS